MTKLVDLPLEEFVALLASDAPAPGGGSAAALAGAQAAALMAMVCRLTIGKKKYAAVEAEATQALAELEQRRAELLALIDADAEVYNGFGRALAMPKETDEQAAARRQAMQAAARQAADVPRRTVEAAAGVARIVVRLYAKTNKNCLSDAGTALHLAWAAVQGASFNVLINLPGTGDEAFHLTHVARLRDRNDEIKPLFERAAAEIADLLGA